MATKLSKTARGVRSAANAAARAASKATKAQAGKRGKAAPAPSPRSRAKPVAKAVRAVRAMTFTLPFRGKVKPPRENSKRAKVLAMLQSAKGATFDEVMKSIGWDRVTTYEGIRLLSIHNGYGLREENGRIHAYTEAAKRSRKANA